MTEVDIGTVSARGQIAIPSAMREKMKLSDGEKVLFVLEGDALVLRKVKSFSWDEVTAPLREAAKRAKLKEADVVSLVHKARK